MIASRRAFRRFLALLIALFSAIALTSCSGSPQDDSDGRPRLGSVAQALTDTDGDGMDDAWETQHFGTLSETDTGDFDRDGMTNGEEFLYSFDPTINDGFDDADGDRYPNVFEVRNASNPNDAMSTPSPTYTVDASGGGTHTTISAALGAADVANGQYQIIGIAPGVYTGYSNLRGVSIGSSKPKLLFIGLGGAGETIIDGELAGYGWWIGSSAVIASLTFRNTWIPLYVDNWAPEVRFIDLFVHDNVGGQPGGWQYAAGVHVNAASKVTIEGSTFLDNASGATTQQIWFEAGAGIITNTVVWSEATGTMLAKASAATLTTNYSLVKGQTLTGTGNLAGSVDPLLRSDAHLLWNSPLRGAGGAVPQSRVDIDGELRPVSAPDIGVDQFIDSDSDDLADRWETDETGNLTTLTSRSQDGDADGLANDEEYAVNAKPTVADTDGDGLSDGDEVHSDGTSPLMSDTDSDDLPDAWEVSYGLAPAVANTFDDDDGDRYPNVFEYAGSSDPADLESIPTPTYTVDASGGGTHTTIGAALGAADVANGAYQIIGIAPGVYTGNANLRGVTVGPSKPKLLVIGLEGAGNTVVDGGQANYGWVIQNSAVVTSLTFRNAWIPLYVDAPTAEVRLVDLFVHDNAGGAPGSWQYAAGVHVNAGRKVIIEGSTFLDNESGAATQQIWFQSGDGTITNTVVWSQATGAMLAKASPATLTTNYSLVKGQTLTGTGNLGGTVDPLLLSDGHLLWNSPLRAAAGVVPQSRIDIDGELRSASTPDIGVDQFNDSDADELADQWELDAAGNLTSLTSRAQDADADGLSNEDEYAALADPTVVDTDGDGASDGDEVNLYGTSPVNTDTDADDMPDGWEVDHGLSALVANTFEDADGDRYPNVFEYTGSSDPADLESIPTPTYTVDASGAGTHTTISAALSAADVVNGQYQIIGIAPGVYTGDANLRNVTVAATKPKLLFIGLEGADETILEGELAAEGWELRNTAVIASLTFRRVRLAMYIDEPTAEVRLVDLFVHDNTDDGYGWEYAAGLHVNAAARVSIIGSTFLDNDGATAAQQIWFGAGEGTLVNTVVWSTSTGTMLGKGSSATLTTNYSLVKGQTLTGTGNLAGNVDPEIHADGRLRSYSALRGAGGTVVQSRIDIDGELRPMVAPDIGVDQFIDADADALPDAWEIATAGDTGTIAGTGDDDGDGLSNAEEHDLETDWLDSDTDNDLVEDGLELTLGTDPFVPDSDDPSGDLNGDGLIDAVDTQLGFSPDEADDDGDSVSNADEVLMCTDVVRADSDGDGVADSVDAFPLDPRASALTSNPQDATAPVITLTDPWYAVEQ